MRFTTLLGLGVGLAGIAGARSGIMEVLDEWTEGPYARYPTDFTRGVIPKGMHSHNDYWRDVPLYSAIANGAISVEADVWLYNETLYIGHDTSSLTESRTFESLYINPLVEILKKQNPTSRFVPSKTRNGVFDTSTGQTLFLFVDLKTSGKQTWPAVVKALAPLRALEYLSAIKDNVLIPGPVTVIGTGSTPLDAVRPLSTRDYFFDGPLQALDSQNITRSISPVASAQLSAAVGEIGHEGLNATQREMVKMQVEAAHKKGIYVRYWDLPAWPVSVRNRVWKDLVRAGVDLLNVDDLEAGAGVIGAVEW
ncbi:alkaline phosphatase [Choiromyces venosus 120613-1]|uniref:Alkaline phosphatase n=1 Tax=Choiromyces venosus 120613-1 TaxID=1336337 RepID=A0A3N4JXE6_9PEZI|nr:alkaline phosphatase [Choiromyces venosus 120613-1]